MVKIILPGVLLLFAGMAQAETGIPWWQFWRSVDEAAGVSSRLFTEDEKHLIQSYYHERREHHYRDDGNGSGRDKPKKKKSLPPGLQKKLERGGELPPGWQEKVARGEVLDADLYGYSRSLPEELLRRLPRYVDGTELRFLDDRVIRVMDDSRAILDVLQVY